MVKRRKLATAIKLAISFGSAAVLVPSSVFAQQDGQSLDSKQASIEEVTVTGSRIRRSDLNSATPISVFGEEEMKAAGNPTIEDFLQDLPIVGGGDYGSSVNNGNDGYATASLRGLGPNRTLILVNGHRMVTAGTEGFVDLNAIPSSIIDSVEVLRGGASSTYGSDAIAGVINVITKKDFEGLSLDAQYDITGEGDGEQYSLSATFGTSFDRGNIIVNTQYTKRADIWQRDRSFSDCPLNEIGGEIVCSGSGTTYPAHIYPDQSAGDWIVDPETGELRAFENGDTYNYAAASYMVTPQEVYSTYAAANYQLVETSKFGSVNASLTTVFSNRKSDQLMAAVGTFWGPEVPANHPNNPFGINRTDGGSPESVYIARRMFETGGRHFTQDANVWNTTFALDGELNNGWYWDVSYTYGRWNDSQIVEGQANQPRIETLLDPDACAADAECPGVWNAFARDSLTPEMIEYATVTHSPVSRNTMRDLQANLGGDFGKFSFNEQPIQWVVGYERRSEDASFTPDGAASLGQIYFVAGDRTEGSYSIDSYYGEVRIPLLSGVTLADTLALEVSARDFEYSSGVSDTTTKVALEWAPIEDLRFRASQSEGFRGANIGELYDPQELTAAQYNDPCLNWGASSDANIRANCAADGLPEDFSLTSTQATGLLGGNPDLDPETSETFTFGAVYTPEFLPDLAITVDYFDIEIDDAIGTVGTDDIITRCYKSANFSDPMCALISGPAAVGAAPSPTSPRRDALQTISGQVLTNANLATFQTSGIDYTVSYGFDIKDARIDLKLTGTYLDKYEYVAFPGAEKTELSGKFGTDPYQGDTPAAFPEWKQNLTAAYNRDNWGVSWTTHYFGEVTDINADSSHLEDDIDAHIIHDVQGYYSFGEMTLTLGIRNLTDEEPPYVTNYDDMNTINYSYDTAGRYMYSRISMNF